MSRDTGVPIFWPPGTPWFIVALAGAFLVARGPTAALPPPTQEAVPAEAGAAVSPGGAPFAPKVPGAWEEDAWGTVELLRRFVGEVPVREKRAREDVRGLLEVATTGRAADLEAQLEALKQYEARARDKERKDAVDALRQVREAVLARADLRTVIAGVTDYHDSNLRWNADEAFDAIQAAAGAAGYSLFDFYLPDWRPAATEAETRKLRDHEREPAALLFKRWGPGERPRLLLILLVPDTPTAGLHGAVIRTALRLSRTFTPTGIEIVGPSFSGSTLSLRMALEEVARDDLRVGLAVRIVSGTATSSRNLAALTRPLPHAGGETPSLRVDFETTVHHDEDLFTALRDQLQRMDPNWGWGRNVALLVESNTGWGVSQARASAESCDFVGPVNPDAPEVSTTLLPCATWLSFPLHISRIVSLSEKDTRQAGPQSVPQWAATLLPQQPLRLEDSVTPSDALPRFTPTTTLAAQMATLKNTLEALAHDEYGAVGIFATDKRDHLFLAREINRVAPNVLMFGTEPHALMLHPDYQPYLRGTLMASSYPIHAHAQRVTSAAGDLGRLQFASMGTQGMFNALLHVLGEDQLLLDYARPWVEGDARPPRRPAPWVVLVGREAFLPVAVGTSTLSEHPTSGTLAWPDKHPGPGVRRDDYLLTSWQARTVWALPLAVLLGHLLVLIVAQSVPVPGFRVFSPPRLFGVGSPSAAEDQHLEHAMLVLGSALALLAALAWQLRIWEVLASDSAALRGRGWPDRARAAFTATLFIAGVVGAALLTVAAVRAWRGRARGQFPLPEIASLGAIGLAVGFAATLAWYLVEPALWSGNNRVFHVERTLGVASLTSPLPVLAAFIGIAYVWTAWSLRSLHHHVVDTDSAAPLFGLLTSRRGRQADALSQGARSTVHPAGAFLLFPGITVAVALLLGTPRTHAVDGQALGWVLVTGSAFGLLAVGIELAQAAWLGRRVKDALDHLRGHALAPSIGALGAEPADWGMSLEPRHGSNRRLLGRWLGGLRGHLASLRSNFASAATTPPAVPTPNRRTALAPTNGLADPWEIELARHARIRAGDVHALSLAVPQPSAPAAGPTTPPAVPEHERPLLRTDLWGQSVAVAALLVPPMERQFWRSRRPVPSTTVPERFLRDAERFVALVSAIIVRTLVVRVVRGLSIAALLGGTLLAGHLLYTFPGRRFWFMLDFFALALVAIVSVRLLISLERDHVLSRLWSSAPGRVGLTSGLLWRAVATASLPLITLLALKFPEVGGSLLAWIEPVRQMMPMP